MLLEVASSRGRRPELGQSFVKQPIEGGWVFKMQKVSSAGHELYGERGRNRRVSYYIGRILVAADGSDRQANFRQSRPVIVKQHLSNGTDGYVRWS